MTLLDRLTVCMENLKQEALKKCTSQAAAHLKQVLRAFESLFRGVMLAIPVEENKLAVAVERRAKVSLSVTAGCAKRTGATTLTCAPLCDLARLTRARQRQYF